MLATSANTSAPMSCNGASAGAGEPTLVMTSSGLCRNSTARSCCSRALDRCTIRFGQIGAQLLPLRSECRRNWSLISPSHLSSCSEVRQFTVGNDPMTPFRQAATTRPTPETRNIGAAISGSLRRSRKRPMRSGEFTMGPSISVTFVLPPARLLVLAFISLPRPGADHKTAGGNMSDPLYAFPTVCGQTLQALARYPSRTAFSWPDGSITYRGATELIGRMQRVLMGLGLQPGTRVAFLTANRAETWCAGVAAQLCRLAITWLHPLGSLEDQRFQIEDSESAVLVVDANAFIDRGGELAARATNLRTVFTIGRASYGVDLLVAAEKAGSAKALSLAGPDDIATLNYTGGTTGKSKGALRYHREYGGFTSAILSGFEIPDTPRYLTVAPISHVAGSKVLPSLVCGGTVHMLKGFDPEVVLQTITRERINFTLFVPTMIYVLLDQPALDSADLSSLELLLYGASAMSPRRLVKGNARIGPVFSQLYGQTECYPISVLRKSDHDPRTPELFLSCGFPISCCEVRILDEEDREVA